MQALTAEAETEAIESLRVAMVQNLGYPDDHPLARSVRQVATDACISSGESILPVLLRLGRPEPWQFLANIVLVAGEIAPEDERVKSLLEDAARHPEPGVRMRVVMAVRCHDSLWARSLIASMATDPDPSVRELL